MSDIDLIKMLSDSYGLSIQRAGEIVDVVRDSFDERRSTQDFEMRQRAMQAQLDDAERRQRDRAAEDARLARLDAEAAARDARSECLNERSTAALERIAKSLPVHTAPARELRAAAFEYAATALQALADTSGGDVVTVTRIHDAVSKLRAEAGGET